MRIKTLTAFLVLLAVLTGPAGADESRMLADELANAPGRSDEDKARDADRKPDQVLAFLGVRKGDTVLDIWASGGWYTEVFSIAVGPDGKVLSQNSPTILAFRDGRYDRLLSERLAGNRLPNVERIDQAVVDADILPGSVDVAFTALNFHDIYNGPGRDSAAAFLAALLELLKPGGTLGIIDHVGDPDADNTALHRIDPAIVEQLIDESGFILEAKSDLLAHPEDDHTKGPFDPALRGHTDRFIFRVRKPE